MAASRRLSAGEARKASSHSRTPIRTRPSGCRASSPCPVSSATSRDAVATCSEARRAISLTGSDGSSGVNTSRIRTARVSTDSLLPLATRRSLARSPALDRVTVGVIPDPSGHPRRCQCCAPRTRTEEANVIVLGIILLLLGLFLKISILWTIGIIVLVIGLVLLLVGTTGRAVGGRKHWY